MCMYDLVSRVAGSRPARPDIRMGFNSGERGPDPSQQKKFLRVTRKTNADFV